MHRRQKNPVIIRTPDGRNLTPKSRTARRIARIRQQKEDILSRVSTAFGFLETALSEERVIPDRKKDWEKFQQEEDKRWESVENAYKNIRSILLQENNIPDSAVVSEESDEEMFEPGIGCAEIDPGDNFPEMDPKIFDNVPKSHSETGNSETEWTDVEWTDVE